MRTPKNRPVTITQATPPIHDATTGAPPIDRATADFKAAMAAADTLIIDGHATVEAIQTRVTAACDALAEQVRAHLSIETPHIGTLAAYVHGETYPYLGLSTLIDRSYTKPRGYAGDFLTLQMVYDDQPSGARRLGPYIDRWFLGIPASCAVKNRRKLLRDLIIGTAQDTDDRPAAVTSLACGPAREIFDIFDEPDHPEIDATCLDIDDQALAYAQGIADRAGVTGRFTFVQANAVKLALGRERLALARSRPGLLDRLDRLFGRSSRGQATGLDLPPLTAWRHSGCRELRYRQSGPGVHGSPAGLEVDPSITTRLGRSVRAIGIRSCACRDPAGSHGINLFASARRPAA